MKKLFYTIIAAVFAFSTLNITNVMAAKTEKDEGVKVAILTGCGNDSDGVGCILRLVVDIMSIGIGVLGVLGIVVVGLQYLTAGGNEEKTRKAKQRMFEIIIGLVAYVVIYAILSWLLPRQIRNYKLEIRTTPMEEATRVTASCSISHRRTWISAAIIPQAYTSRYAGS